jgi:hypothetical protein
MGVAGRCARSRSVVQLCRPRLVVSTVLSSNKQSALGTILPEFHPRLGAPIIPVGFVATSHAAGDNEVGVIQPRRESTSRIAAGCGAP